MSLSPGMRFGHYDVTSLLGEGGMGQVWQATDTQLNRRVALKILPDAFAADPDRLARLTREAQILASLNHPNIAAIHGIEEAEGTPALVLELVEGPTLADRIAEGPMPPDQALAIATQIAHALTMRGRHYRFTRYDMPAARQCYEEAVRHDADYALAWAGIAEEAVTAGYFGLEPPAEAWARARRAVDRALAIDESLSEGHASLARIQFWFDWRWADAEQEYQVAVSLNPANPDAHNSFAAFLAVTGRTDEALRQIAMAREVDPLSASAPFVEGFALQLGRRYDEAFDADHRALELHPTNSGALFDLVLTHHACARHEEALALLQTFPTTSTLPMSYEAHLGRALGLAGHTEEAQAVLQRLKDRGRQGYVPPNLLAIVHFGLGQVDEMLHQLELAYEERSPALLFLQRPVWDAVRAEPRFEALVRRIGLPDIVATR